MGKNNNEINSKDFLIGTLIGSLLGAAAALLLAPKSGRELREDLSEGAEQIRGKASEWSRIAQEKGSDLTEKAIQKGTEFKERATETTSKLSDAVKSKINDADEEE